MTGQPQTLRALRGLRETLREALAESELAYEFAANSYSFSAMDACMRAERALDLLREALEADERRKEHIEVGNQQRRMDNDLQYDLPK